MSFSLANQHDIYSCIGRWSMLWLQHDGCGWDWTFPQFWPNFLIIWTNVHPHYWPMFRIWETILHVVSSPTVPCQWPPMRNIGGYLRNNTRPWIDTSHLEPMWIGSPNPSRVNKMLPHYHVPFANNMNALLRSVGMRPLAFLVSLPRPVGRSIFWYNIVPIDNAPPRLGQADPFLRICWGLVASDRQSIAPYQEPSVRLAVSWSCYQIRSMIVVFVHPVLTAWPLIRHSPYPMSAGRCLVPPGLREPLVVDASPPANNFPHDLDHSYDDSVVQMSHWHEIYNIDINCNAIMLDSVDLHILQTYVNLQGTKILLTSTTLPLLMWTCRHRSLLL